MQRINVIKLSDNQPIFGALNINIKKFVDRKDGELVFELENGEIVKCTKEMALRLQERLRINLMRNQVLDEILRK
jgi:hypothetical protein